MSKSPNQILAIPKKQPSASKTNPLTTARAPLCISSLSFLPSIASCSKIDTVLDRVQGAEVHGGRYGVGAYLDCGQNGEVYEAVDLYESTDSSDAVALVIKIQPYSCQF